MVWYGMGARFNKIMQCRCFTVKSPPRTTRNRRESYSNNTLVGRTRITYPSNTRQYTVKSTHSSVYRYNAEYRLVDQDGELLHEEETELDIHNEKVLHTTELLHSESCTSNILSGASYDEIESRPIISYILDLNQCNHCK